MGSEVPTVLTAMLPAVPGPPEPYCSLILDPPFPSLMDFASHMASDLPTFSRSLVPAISLPLQPPHWAPAHPTVSRVS